MKNRILVPFLAGILCLSTAASGKGVSKIVLDAKVKEALSSFYDQTSAGKELAEKAAGVLVFPKVAKAGLVIGGEHGNGALLIKGKTVAYYSTTAASIGLQVGAQVKTEIILFMTEESLKGFRNASGWEVGLDGSVAIATIGAGGEIDSTTANEPIIGFITDNKGLMANLTLEGAKISQLDL